MGDTDESYPFDLGLDNTASYSLSILEFSGSDEKELLWLKRGLLWCYAFNHEEGSSLY
jgi:hypothetical protein